MKINKLVITIFFSAVGLFVSTALQAQEAKTLFVNIDRKSTRLNSSHPNPSRMPSSA